MVIQSQTFLKSDNLRREFISQLETFLQHKKHGMDCVYSAETKKIIFVKEIKGVLQHTLFLEGTIWEA